MIRVTGLRFLRAFAATAAVLTALGLSGCGYNNFQSQDEQVKAAWAEVLNQYQRRSDLVPNIVATVKGEASFEQDTLTKVIEARARATSIQASPELVNDPEAFDKFQKAQGELTGALSRLMVVAEQYPQLKLTENFQQLSKSTIETEHKIADLLIQYNRDVNAYMTVRSCYPGRHFAWILDFPPKQFISVEPENMQFREVTF